MDYQLYILQILHSQGSTYKLHFATCIITEAEGIPRDFDYFNTLIPLIIFKSYRTV